MSVLRGPDESWLFVTLMLGLAACSADRPSTQVLPTVTVPQGSTQGATTMSTKAGKGVGDSGITSGISTASMTSSTSLSLSTVSSSLGAQSSSPGQTSAPQDTAGPEAGKSIPKKPKVRWTKGHGDIRIVWSEAKKALEPQILLSDDAIVDGKPLLAGQELVFDPADLVVVLGHRMERPADQTGPELDPLCVAPGASMFFIPASPVKDKAVPFLGIANRLRDTAPVKGRRITYVFRGIHGPVDEPVHFSMWQFHAKGIKFFASSCDGFDVNDEVDFSWGHDHFSMGFVGPAGPWELEVQAKAELNDETQTQVSFSLNFEFLAQ